MPNRIFDLTGGVAMIVTDLHGDRDAFDRCIAHFRACYRRDEAQRLIVLGDLIHGYGPPESDSSLSMVLDLMRLRDELGPDTVIMLLGNHEMPHIYGVSLAKGDIEFTPRFEHALGPHRDQVLAFFDSLPFFIRTAAGVMLCHAGPDPAAAYHLHTLRTFDHQALLQEAEDVLGQTDDLDGLLRGYAKLSGASYDEMARHYLAVDGPDDPRYPHLLRAFMITQQNKRFEVLWDALFTQNERGRSRSDYRRDCQDFLEAFSVDAPDEQQVVVSGHIVTPDGGYAVVNKHHLRVSSATHARPRDAGQFLLLDCAQPVRSASDLLDGLWDVFD
jgi:hypothetical protein